MAKKIRAMIPIMQINELSIGYTNRNRTIPISSFLNASLYQGELVCMLGANGKGKSTLLKTLCKFIPRLSGNIHIGKQSVDLISDRYMARNVSIVLTEKLNVPNATVYELVGYGRSPYTGLIGNLSKEDHVIIDQAIELCGIAHKKNEFLTSLSDGERQKASIAKALAQDTPIILLDEPTAFLDLPSRVEIMKLLTRLARKSKKAILMSIHDLDLALQMADKLWLLHENQLICGSPEDLLYQNAFQQFFSNSGIAFDNRLGIFRVDYQNKNELPVKGHGFEYVLLRRAFAREGINLVKAKNLHELWLNIDRSNETPFQLYLNQQLVSEEKSVEKIVQYTLQHLYEN